MLHDNANNMNYHIHLCMLCRSHFYVFKGTIRTSKTFIMTEFIIVSFMYVILDATKSVWTLLMTSEKLKATEHSQSLTKLQIFELQCCIMPVGILQHCN